jgi:hypothetical protein
MWPKWGSRAVCSCFEKLVPLAERRLLGNRSSTNGLSIKKNTLLAKRVTKWLCHSIHDCLLFQDLWKLTYHIRFLLSVDLTVPIDRTNFSHRCFPRFIIFLFESWNIKINVIFMLFADDQIFLVGFVNYRSQFTKMNCTTARFSTQINTGGKKILKSSIFWDIAPCSQSVF